MRLVFVIAGVLLSGISLYAQELTILHNITSLPVENAAIYNKSYTIAVYTNGEGKADLKKFSRNDSIYIRHPSINTIGLTYQDIVDMNFVLLISKRSILMDDIVVTAYRWQEKKRELPFQTDIIKIREMTIPQTSADILSSAGNLMLQKSQGGGGSPVIRGFEANRVLLVLDGVRLNNAIYRSGHLQNSMTIDMGGLDRVEIIYGPASVIYGSDALGGVVHYHTREPILSDENKFLIKADAFTKYSSASNSNISSFGINAGFKKFAWFSSYTVSNFGDIRMGKNRNPFLGDHGKAYYQAVFLDGRDSVVSNTNTDIQPNTGYRQFDLTQKILVLLGRNLKLSGNFQYSTSSRIHRYDELSIFNNAVPNYATWYYGPQNRLFGSVSLFSEGETVLFSGYKAVLAYQRIDEDRINRRFRRDNELHQEEDVDVFSFNLDFRKSLSPRDILEYGFESTYNNVNSNGYNKNIRNGAISEALSRYPDKGSTLGTVATYAGYKWNPESKFRLAAGLRYFHTFIHSEFSEDYDMIPFSKVNISTGALTGSGSVIFYPRTDTKFSVIVSTGYRAPNVDDFGKVRAKDQEVTLPGNTLKPEYAFNAEFGAEKTFGGVVSSGFNVYYTLLTNAIVSAYSTYNGKDSLNYNGDMYRIVTNTNSDKAYITGASVFLNVKLNEKFGLENTINYTYGRDKSNDVPLAHIPPVFGKSSISFERKIFQSELYVAYHGWKRKENYGAGSEDNLNYATVHGAPSWATLNLNTVTKLGKHLQLQLAIENIFDTYYRVFASGVSASGRNYIVSLKATI